MHVRGRRRQEMCNAGIAGRVPLAPRVPCSRGGRTEGGQARRAASPSGIPERRGLEGRVAPLAVTSCTACSRPVLHARSKRAASLDGDRRLPWHRGRLAAAKSSTVEIAHDRHSGPSLPHCPAEPAIRRGVIGLLLLVRGCATGIETIGCRAVGLLSSFAGPRRSGRRQSLRLRQATHRGGLHMEPVQLAASLSEAGPGVNYADAGHRLGIADVDPAFDEVDVSRRETA